MTIDELRHANTLSIEIDKYNCALRDCERLSKAIDVHEQFMADTWSNYDYDEENDVLIPYNCITGTKHYWLFDDLNTGDET